MESLNVVPSSKVNNRYQSQDQINSPQLPPNILDLEEPQHARSFCEYARSESLQKYPNMVESPDVVKKTSDKQLPIGKSPRISLKLEQINKIDHQEFEPEMSAKFKRPIFEFYKPKEEGASTKKKDKKEKKKVVQDENKNPKDTKETKKSGFGSYGMKIFKSTFRSEKKRGSSGSDANRRKSLDEVGTNEVDERDQQKIGQVSRPQLNLKPVSSLGEHIQPEIAQEENPLSSGHLRLSMGESLKMKKGSVDFKAKTVDDGELRAAETIQSINIEEKLSYGKKRSLDAKTAWSSVDFTRDEKTDTKTTLEVAKPKVAIHSYSGIMKFGTLVDRIAKRRHFGTILMPKKRNTWEKVLEYGMLALIFAFIFYCVLPFAILFTAHDYNKNYVRTYFNFGFLGFLQGVVEISLIYCVADRPILRRIKEIEGENEGLIDSNIYRLLPPFKAVLLLLSKIGAQIISGVVIDGLGYDVQTANILVGTISNIAITVVFWFLFLLLQNPTRKENRKQILSKELRQIGDIRKDFIENLQKTRRELDNKVNECKFDLEEQEKLGGKQQSRVAHMGIVAGITSGVKVEVRKFYCDVSEYSGEFIRLRLKVLRAYAALLLSVLQLFALLSILKVINDNDSLFISLPLVVSLLIVGTLFGYIDFFNSPDRPIMTTNRIINMLITIGAYRFFYLTVSNKWAMIGAVILKFGYKFVAYYMFILTNSHLTKYWREIIKKRVLRKEVKPNNYIMREEKELAIVTPLRYIFQKFIVLQNFDLYFGIGTVVLLCASRFWLPDLEFGLNLRIENFNFYIGLALLEAALDVLVWMHFSSLAKGIIRKHTSLIDSSNTLEMKDIMENRGLIIIAFKAFILFVYLFIFMNSL